jgi:hypothetical protein
MIISFFFIYYSANGLRCPRAGFTEPLLFLERLFGADFRASGARFIGRRLTGTRGFLHDQQLPESTSLTHAYSIPQFLQ